MPNDTSSTYEEAVTAETNLLGEPPEYVVGIGASAGGLEALEELFSSMPFQTGMAFVIIQHLSPDYKSMMDELLARKTMIPIRVAADQMPLEADSIYLLPPKKEMIAANGRLYLTERESGDFVNLPINTFFRSLAETYEEKCIAIVLSGTGSDGSKGVPLVHDCGGFVIAQEPDSCRFDSMPSNAIATNKVDLVLSPERIPEALIKYSKRTATVEQQIEQGSIDPEVGEFSEILILLHSRFDLDFSQYKPSTITRRLERRLAYRKASSLREYINVLVSNHDELELLYRDLLIGVTRFFRDSGAFKSLRAELPKMLEHFQDEAEIRIWVAACATGQEAYSMAMLMTEVMAESPYGKKPFKIFATDIHSRSIQTAATGIYREDEMLGLEDSYRKRFFTPLSSGSYQVNAEIRKPIVFAQHNLLKDPPFTRTQIVNCRNLLIYFNNVAQQRVLSLLSFSLMNQGIMFLGPSESIGNHSSDFHGIDSNRRIFRKSRDSSRRIDMPLTVSPKPSRALKASASGRVMSVKSKKAMEILLQRYVPASILVDQSGDVLHVFGDAGDFLSISFGAVSLNIRAMVKDQAKAVVSQMLQQVVRTGNPLKSRAVTGFSTAEPVDIEMHLLSEASGDQSYVIISLRNSQESCLEASGNEAGEVVGEVSALVTTARIRELEDELKYTQESLQSTVEELEASNEELQAANEELMASNEELQSTNEELQSVNEELFTVNNEFQKKERERSQLKSDERSIIEESNIGILFLDDRLRVRKLSPAAAHLFNLIDDDFGRPFSAASGRIVSQLQQDIYAVFKGGGLVERELVDEDGSVYLIRINAHQRDEAMRSQEDGELLPCNSGIVLTFTNITRYRVLQNALEQTQRRFHSTLDAISDGYFEWTMESDESYFSQTFLQQLGYSEELPDLNQLLGDQVDTFKNRVREGAADGRSLQEVLRFVCKDGQEQWMICKGRVMHGTEKESSRFTGILMDFSRQKLVEGQLSQQASDLERSNQLLEQFAHIVSHDMKAPLRHIQSYLGFLEHAIKQGDSDAIESEIRALKENTDGLGELIDDIITYSRVTSEKKAVDDVNINEIIESVLTTLSPVILEKSIRISTVELPLLRGDRNLLTHLFQNLIGNACKYTDKEQPDIAISYEIERDYCVIDVRDNGIGFDPAFADRIFAPFQRLVSKAQFEGTGIGLSICKTVVEQHGGTISASSALGEGACFTVSLPMS